MTSRPLRALLGALLLGPIAATPVRTAAAAPDTFLARVQALASIETLNAQILASASATKALEHWCAVHAMAAPPTIRAELVRGDPKPLDDAGRKRLGLGTGEPVAYRHVRLICGTHILSEADNWYVPGRLTADMNRQLETTDVPFGKAVAALHFTRETFAVSSLWAPLPDDWQIRAPAPDHPERALVVPPVLFEHEAVLFDAAHRPFSEVIERYTRDALAFWGSPRTP